jgi:hypothetical protein
MGPWKMDSWNIEPGHQAGLNIFTAAAARLEIVP